MSWGGDGGLEEKDAMFRKSGRALGTRMGFRGHAPASGQIPSIGTWKQKIRNKRRED